LIITIISLFIISFIRHFTISLLIFSFVHLLFPSLLLFHYAFSLSCHSLRHHHYFHYYSIIHRWSLSLFRHYYAFSLRPLSFSFSYIIIYLFHYLSLLLFSPFNISLLLFSYSLSLSLFFHYFFIFHYFNFIFIIISIIFISLFHFFTLLSFSLFSFSFLSLLIISLSILFHYTLLFSSFIFILRLLFSLFSCLIVYYYYDDYDIHYYFLSFILFILLHHYFSSLFTRSFRSLIMPLFAIIDAIIIFIILFHADYFSIRSLLFSRLFSFFSDVIIISLSIMPSLHYFRLIIYSFGHMMLLFRCRLVRYYHVNLFIFFFICWLMRLLLCMIFHDDADHYAFMSIIFIYFSLPSLFSYIISCFICYFSMSYSRISMPCLWQLSRIVIYYFLIRCWSLFSIIFFRYFDKYWCRFSGHCHYHVWLFDC